eukprot:6191719-Pleurochrysis_carterae.AAC.1
MSQRAEDEPRHDRKGQLKRTLNARLAMGGTRTQLHGRRTRSLATLRYSREQHPQLRQTCSTVNLGNVSNTTAALPGHATRRGSKYVQSSHKARNARYTQC